MPFSQQAVIDQIDSTMARCNLRSPKGYSDYSDLHDSSVSEAVTLLVAAIERLAPPGSAYVKSARVHEKNIGGTAGRAYEPLIGILKALRSDYESGYLQNIQELIHADIFADFLEMAEHLIEQGYKDPAAVIVGSTLEETLRKLCTKSNISLIQSSGAIKKADSMNNDLAAAQVYSKLDQKSVTAWLDLRNKAAHGRYNDYTKEQVVLSLQGVRDFIIRNSA